MTTTSKICTEGDISIPTITVPPHPEWPRQSSEEENVLKDKIRALLNKENAVLVAHYYTQGVLQDLAEETGGCVADSLEMARFGKEHPAQTLVVAGVRFMGETSKILSNDKRVLMPDLAATCSLDEGCPYAAFDSFCNEHEDLTVVVYANTSAEVKARADWVVTSGIALPIIKHLAEKGEKILWAPDRHLGSYVQKLTGVEMLLWPGSCVVHEEFRSVALERLRKLHPDAAVLVHPESTEDVVAQADVVGSTTALIDAVAKMPNKEYIVATDASIFNKMKQVAPDKILMEAPTAGEGATCQSCANCPWMGMNSLHNLASVFDDSRNEIHISKELADRAKIPIMRMLDFAAKMKK